MARQSKDNALDHVVVVMFENRSFDNVLDRLYQQGEVESFEGVIGKGLSNPIPAWAEDGADRRVVPYGVAENMDTPNPDPGEEYQHVNTQLFGLIDPPGNRGVLAQRMAAPYNAPGDPLQRPPMDGFVADYTSTFTAETGRQPKYDEYAQIMTGYTPEQMPVTSALARGFATFDHWFCEVPSQTFTNRSFFHAGSASGYVLNLFPGGSFPVDNTAETVFERLESKSLTWRVYCDPPSLSFTGIMHAARLRDRFAQNFFTTDQFMRDAKEGKLPAYSFIEPNMLHGHSDMHPAVNSLFPGLKGTCSLASKAGRQSERLMPVCQGSAGLDQGGTERGQHVVSEAAAQQQQAREAAEVASRPAGAGAQSRAGRCTWRRADVGLVGAQPGVLSCHCRAWSMPRLARRSQVLPVGWAHIGRPTQEVREEHEQERTKTGGDDSGGRCRGRCSGCRRSQGQAGGRGSGALYAAVGQGRGTATGAASAAARTGRRAAGSRRGVRPRLRRAAS